MAALRVLLAACLCALAGMKASLAETSSIIDPTESAESPKPPAAAVQRPAQADPVLKRERQRAAAEQRRRAKAEARAAAAEKESERLRALEQARASEAAAREAAARAAARKAAARAAAVRAAAQSAARLAARKEAAARELAAREAMAREAAARELAAREAAAKEAAAKEAAAREAALREAAAKEAAARETAAKEAALRAAAAREAADRLVATRQASAREQQRALKLLPTVGKAFRDCADCPEMIWLPQGAFALGEAADGGARARVSIQYPLAVGRFEVTFAEWDACVGGGGCRNRPYDAGWGRGSQPVINVSWLDARQYTAWLSRVTNHAYRLLTEAEWEYAARAGTDARYWWGDQPGRGDANCADCGSRWDGRRAAPTGRFAPNPFGLYDMHGNVAEWVEDCYHDRVRDTPPDGRAWGCTSTAEARVVRGGAWYASARSMRSSFRTSAASGHVDNGIGFRVARTELP